MADDSFYMKQALQEARKAAGIGEVPVGAVVVCRDRIIARTHNLTETLTDVTAHAEMQAITAAANALGGEIPEYVYALCDGGAVCDVCGCHCLGPDRETGIRGVRRKERIPEICSGSPASEDGGRAGCTGRRVRSVDERFL